MKMKRFSNDLFFTVLTAIVAIGCVLLHQRFRDRPEPEAPPPVPLTAQEYEEFEQKRACKHFVVLAQEGSLKKLMERHSTFNIELPDLTGKLLWNNLAASRGWKFQECRIGGICRILDADGFCQAWGSRKQLDELIFDRPASLAANYREDGYRFVFYSGYGPKKGTVILIHGLANRISKMSFFAENLARNGYDVLGYDYPTTETGIAEHGKIFLQKVRGLLNTLPAKEKIAVITHSMGALVFRTALAEMTVPELRRISGVVMLAPPNQGSTWADLAEFPGMKELLPALTDMKTDPGAFVSRIPEPKAWLPIGIVRGKKDIEVPAESVKLKESPYRLTEVDCGHEGLQDSQEAFEKSLRFLQTGKF